MKNYIIKYLSYLSRPMVGFVFGFLFAVIPMLIGVKVLSIEEYGPEFSFGIPFGIGLKIMMDSVYKI